METVVEDTLERWFTPAFLADGGADQVRRDLLAEDPEVWAMSWRAISELDTLPRLPSVERPTLCIAGEVDRGAPPAVVERIAAAIPGARYALLPGAPHMMQIECPGPFAQLLSGFLDGTAVP